MSTVCTIIEFVLVSLGIICLILGIILVAIKKNSLFFSLYRKIIMSDETNFDHINVYDDIKRNLKTGDLLLWKTNKLYDLIYRRIVSGYSNHAGMAFRLTEYEGSERRYTTDAYNHNGTALNRVSNRLDKPHYGLVTLYRLKDEYDGHRNKIGEIALNLIGKDYDKLAILISTSCISLKRSDFFSKLLPKKCPGPDEHAPCFCNRCKADANYLFCSEYLDFAYREIAADQIAALEQHGPPHPDEIAMLDIFKDPQPIYNKPEPEPFSITGSLETMAIYIVYLICMLIMALILIIIFVSNRFK